MNKLFNNVCLLYLLDIFLGGGGTILSIKGITLRMVLFIFIFLLFIIKIMFKKKINIFYSGLIYIFSSLLLLGVLLGIINNAPIQLIIQDIQPLISFFMIYPLFIFLQNTKLQRISKIIMITGLIQALVYLMCYLIMKFKIVPFQSYYSFFSNLGTREIFFRGQEKFFYKGFLYMNISFLFYINKKKKTIIDKFILLILILAIYLTDTRGFLLALLLCLGVHILIKEKLYKKIFYFFISIPIVFKTYIILFKKISEDRGGGDQSRLLQISQVMENITIKSLFVGHGYGVGIPERKVHMEIVYLEIFHKQGIVGLVFYLFLLVYIYILYIKIKDKEIKQNLYPYLIGSFFIYFESLTNPFLINPIGLTFLLISIVFIRKNMQNLVLE